MNEFCDFVYNYFDLDKLFILDCNGCIDLNPDCSLLIPLFLLFVGE